MAGLLAALLMATVGNVLAAAPGAADSTRTVTTAAEADTFVSAAFPGSNPPAGATVQSADLRIIACNGFAYGGDGNQ